MFKTPDQVAGGLSISFILTHNCILLECIMNMMTLALKGLAILTLNMGILIFESVIFIHGWMPARMALMILRFDAGSGKV